MEVHCCAQLTNQTTSLPFREFVAPIWNRKLRIPDWNPDSGIRKANGRKQRTRHWGLPFWDLHCGLHSLRLPRFVGQIWKCFVWHRVMRAVCAQSVYQHVHQIREQLKSGLCSETLFICKLVWSLDGELFNWREANSSKTHSCKSNDHQRDLVNLLFLKWAW